MSNGASDGGGVADVVCMEVCMEGLQVQIPIPQSSDPTTLLSAQLRTRPTKQHMNQRNGVDESQ